MRVKIEYIVNKCIDSVKPDIALKKALSKAHFNTGRNYVIAIGKAGWLMAKTAREIIDDIEAGIVITKYGHSQGEIKDFEIFEAGHPILDENSIKATDKVLELTKNLNSNDNVIFLLSGGGSALFESPIIPLEMLQDITSQLLKSGADINEINIIRKRLSKVKGGKFALHCYPATVYNYILSDVVGSQLDSIASGPTVEDSTSLHDCKIILDKYHIVVDNLQDSIHKLNNVKTEIIGDCSLLAKQCKKVCEELGYQSTIVSDCLCINVDDAINIIDKYTKDNQNPTTPLAFIFAGENTVIVKGKGLGGRNQQLALMAAEKIKDYHNTTIICFSSDGSDGPTIATGGFVDNNTYNKAISQGIDIDGYLENNDSYHCLEKLNQLIVTGPTNTNVNDLTIILIS